MSLYNLHGNPVHPMMPVNATPAIQAEKRNLHFGISNTEGRLTYHSASFMPKQNSHRYWRKKLFHTRSSAYPNSPTMVDHKMLMARAIQYPPPD